MKKTRSLFVVCFLITVIIVMISLLLFCSGESYVDLDSVLQDQYYDFQIEGNGTVEVFSWNGEDYKLLLNSSYDLNSIRGYILNMDFKKINDPVYICLNEKEINKAIISNYKEQKSSSFPLKYSLWSSNEKDGIILLIPYKQRQIFEEKRPFCYLLIRG